MEIKNEFPEFELSEISTISKKVIHFAEDINIWVFEGEMGAGKTTFIKEICKILGVNETVTSPTFSIINEYQTIDKEPIYHFDFYRIRHESEALDIGVDEYFCSGHNCLIEWPSKVPSLIPKKHLKVNIKITGEKRRKVFVEKLI